MARPLRIEYDGALYHITARGNERNPIYRKEGDYQRFLGILSDLPQRYGILIHGYVLMGNHYHLLIETPKGNIKKVMHYLNATYAGYFNKKYGRVGHLFQGRYKGILVEKERYLLSLSKYLHLNPVRVGITERPEGYKWSSYPEYIGMGKRSKWLTSEWILGQYSRDEEMARRHYRAFVNEGLTLKENPFKDVKAGLILGSEGFIEGIKKRLKLKTHREVPETRRLTKRISYEDIIAVLIKMMKVREEEIKETGRRNNLARKLSLYLLRKHTDMSNNEIGGYFGIGYTAVSQAVSRIKREMDENTMLKKTVQDIEEVLLSEE